MNAQWRYAVVLIAGLAIPIVSVAQPGAPATPPKRLEASADPVNQGRFTQPLNALVVPLEIDGDRVDVGDTRIVSIPVDRAEFNVDSGNIVVRALNSRGTLVGQTSMPDPRYFARDGEYIELEKRSLTLLVPLLAKPARIVITRPDDDTETPVSIEELVRDFCRAARQAEICGDENPENNPLFDLLDSS
jgi:hypothetical protein